MFGPLEVGALCMVALVIWWVYRRELLPAIMTIGGGLILTLSRSAWVGLAVAIVFLGTLMRQSKRLLLYASLALTLFMAAIPVCRSWQFSLGDHPWRPSLCRGSQGVAVRRSAICPEPSVW